MDRRPLSIIKREAHVGAGQNVQTTQQGLTPSCREMLACSRPAPAGAGGHGNGVIREEGKRLVQSG